MVSVDKGIAQARLDGVLKLKHKSLNFNVSPPADTEEIAQIALVGYIDFAGKQKQVRAFRLLADKATSRNGQVVYAVAVSSQQAKAGPKEARAPKETLLFDFERPADLKVWSNLELPDVKHWEPPVKIELSAENATRGKHSLRLTFAGGRWPTVTTTDVPADWMPYWTFRADVTASRYCLAGFTVMQEKSQRGGGWDPTVSRRE